MLVMEKFFATFFMTASDQAMEISVLANGGLNPFESPPGQATPKNRPSSFFRREYRRHLDGPWTPGTQWGKGESGKPSRFAIVKTAPAGQGSEI
jgi:hypothetical protein